MVIPEFGSSFLWKIFKLWRITGLEIADFEKKRFLQMTYFLRIFHYLVIPFGVCRNFHLHRNSST